MKKLTLTDIQVKEKKVLMRVDFNVPLKDGVITDDNRIVQALPSIKYVVEHGGLLILTSHLGRPDGKSNPEFSLKPVADHLATLIETKVHFATDCIGDEAKKVIEQADFGEIVLLENVRFHKEETENDEIFSGQLASHADVFVNDAFGSSHRAHASVAGVTRFMDQSVSGFLLEKEIKYLSESVNNPERPFVAILGGAKVSDKIGVIENLLDKVDTIIIGGGMTYTFYKALGLPIGNSLLEEDKIDLAKELVQKAKAAGVKLMLPMDSVVAKEFDNDAEHKVVNDNGIEDGWMALDIGPQSAISFGNVIKMAKTVLWNGPMGVFEMSNYADGTFAVAEALAEATKFGATTIIGGGDSAAAIKKSGLSDQVSHVSTGGGASLEYLEGKDLPGVSSLTEK
ncbi:MAG: phosphoglycerate kinase [Balneola sp.]|nr:phosphoglycerate kinase [Balneola sp.]MBO6651518.1 phosphoglycerate kinase [Balneola sp.]MBO6710272.1 phosphoglycerate kinase [Balneola sp.]MBO6798957.1 phosphoglycerate kinase [Balneola sp.]MBO6870071.1 phosphoglycerate kinase [Balneola sp.]